jgi:hypothetical protein
MFDEIDDALRQLLIREIPIRSNEVEIAFEHPKREWSARLNRPTLNLFLHDVRENVDLRNSYQHYARPNGDQRTATLPRPTHRVDLHYMVTAWASEPDDEHRLLARTMLSLLRVPELPSDLLSVGLAQQPSPIQLKVARYDSPLNPADIWGVLDNELRPTLNCTVTLTMDPHAPIEVPVVRTRELRVGDIDALSYRRQRQEGGGPVRFIGRPRNIAVETESVERSDQGQQWLAEYWTVGGQIQLEAGTQAVHLIVQETGVEVPVAGDGRFVIGHLHAGNYTLVITIDGEEREHKMEVPSAEYLDL